jgi:hypothetical protein
MEKMDSLARRGRGVDGWMDVRMDVPVPNVAAGFAFGPLKTS